MQCSLTVILALLEHFTKDFQCRNTLVDHCKKVYFLSIYLLVLPTSLTSILGRSARRRVTYKRARVGADNGHGEAKIRGKKVTPSVKREVR